MSDRKVGYVIDRHQCSEAVVETGVPLGSPVLPILFRISLVWVFREGRGEVEDNMIRSFAEDCEWLVVTDFVEQLCPRLARTGIRAVKRGKRNHLQFDNSKNKMIVFTRQEKTHLRKRLTEDLIIVRCHSLKFNTKRML